MHYYRRIATGQIEGKYSHRPRSSKYYEGDGTGALRPEFEHFETSDDLSIDMVPVVTPPTEPTPIRIVGDNLQQYEIYINAAGQIRVRVV